MIFNVFKIDALTFAMLFFMFSLGICFFVFVYNVIGGTRKGKESFIFFDYVFYGKGLLSNLSLIVFLISYILGFLVEIKRDDFEFHVYAPGLVAIFLFMFHCRFFSENKFNSSGRILFVSELLSLSGHGFKSSFLWGARAAYIVFFSLLIFG